MIDAEAAPYATLILRIGLGVLFLAHAVHGRLAHPTGIEPKPKKRRCQTAAGQVMQCPAPHSVMLGL